MALFKHSMILGAALPLLSAAASAEDAQLGKTFESFDDCPPTEFIELRQGEPALTTGIIDGDEFPHLLDLLEKFENANSEAEHALAVDGLSQYFSLTDGTSALFNGCVQHGGEIKYTEIEWSKDMVQSLQDIYPGETALTEATQAWDQLDIK